MATHSSVLAWRIPGSLVGCRLWGRTKSDRTEVTQQQRQPKHFLFSSFSISYSVFSIGTKFYVSRDSSDISKFKRKRNAGSSKCRRGYPQPYSLSLRLSEILTPFFVLAVMPLCFCFLFFKQNNLFLSPIVRPVQCSSLYSKQCLTYSDTLLYTSFIKDFF